MERTFDKIWITQLIAKLTKAKNSNSLNIYNAQLSSKLYILCNSKILIQVYIPLEPEYLRAAYSDPQSSIFILTTFHQFRMTLTWLSHSMLMIQELVFGLAV
jgi:hypothetical protein